MVATLAPEERAALASELIEGLGEQSGGDGHLPTLSEWAQAVFVLVIVVSGLLMLRRRATSV